MDNPGEDQSPSCCRRQSCVRCPRSCSPQQGEGNAGVMDHQQLLCSPLLGQETRIPLGLPEAVCQGCAPGASSITHAQRSHSGGYPCAQHSDRGRQLPTGLCNTEPGVELCSRAWGKQQAWDMGSSRLSAGASPQGTWQHGEWVPRGILCAVTHPSNPKALVASGQGRKRRAMLVLSAFPALTCATCPDSSARMLSTWMNPHP